MEYSKEDLMEAKKQIWGVGENMGTEESKKIWEENAQFWDNAMGDESNEFHREVVRPKVTELLSPNPADYILDIACGNGNYSSYLAQRGASVVAFDYSKKMIELAKRRQSQYAKQIEFCVADATDRKSILELKRNRAFTKAVSNMAIMDITDIEPLLMAVYELLQESGIFVFATQHPCFVTLTEKYMTPHSYYDIAIEGQPKEQIYYHRSIQDIFNLCFRAGFVIDGFYEECFKTNKEIPMVIVADGLFCREIDGLFCRSSPDIIVRRRCVLSHKRRGWLQPSPSFRYSRNLALQDELYHPVINNGPAVLVCVDKRLGTGPVNQSRDAG